MKSLNLIAIAIILTIVSCGKKPESVAENFMTAILESDVETAKKNSTETSHKILPMMMMFIPNMMEKEGKSIEEAKKNLNSMECDIDEDKAKCGPKNGKKTLTMVKVDGDWKVDVRKD